MKDLLLLPLYYLYQLTMGAGKLIYQMLGLIVNAIPYGFNFLRQALPLVFGFVKNISALLLTPQFLFVVIPLTLLVLLAPGFTLKLAGSTLKLIGNICKFVGKAALTICLFPLKFFLKKNNASSNNRDRYSRYAYYPPNAPNYMPHFANRHNNAKDATAAQRPANRLNGNNPRQQPHAQAASAPSANNLNNPKPQPNAQAFPAARDAAQDNSQGRLTLNRYLASFEGKQPISEQYQAMQIDLPDGHEFVCPISLDVMNKPVYIDQHNFDYDNIMSIPPNISGQRLHPLTRTPFRITDIMPAPELYAKIEDYLKNHVPQERPNTNAKPPEDSSRNVPRSS